MAHTNQRSGRWTRNPRLRVAAPALLFAFLLFALAASPLHAQEPAATGTTISQDITQDTVWTKAGSPYNVTQFVTVRAGARLTVEAGVTVVVSPTSGLPSPLMVKGTLLAQGTAAEPILFTGGVKAPGSWGGLVAGNTNEQPAQITLDHVVVEYGQLLNANNRGNLELLAAVADVNNSLFRFGGAHGLSIATNSQITLRNSSFVGNNNSAVLVAPGTTLRDPEFSNLSATDNKDFNAVVYSSVKTRGTHRLEKMGLPYVFKGGFEVLTGGSLQVDPGVELRVESGFTVRGAMHASGLAAEPVRFTGIQPQPGGWWGLQVHGTPEGLASARLDHVVVEFGGQVTGASLVVSSANVTVTNTVLRDGLGDGVRNEGGDPEEVFGVSIASTTITGHAKRAIVCDDEVCSMSLTNLTVTGNGQDAVFYRAHVFDKTTWRNVGLPYIVEGGAGVAEGGELTIEPGVEVRMAEGASFTVGGTLTAAGTAQQKIRFTGTQPQPGWWQGIMVRSPGVANLSECEVGYGGNWGSTSGVGMIWAQTNGLFVSKCHIHHSASAGILVGVDAEPTIRNNRIEDNLVGLEAQFRRNALDARSNWWGHASGPKHPNNPQGQGQQVSGDVLFDPWLTNPEGGDDLKGIFVELSGPGRYAPGQTIVYAIMYLNNTGGPIHNAVLRYGMPPNAALVEATPGAVFHAPRNHVFWNLGELPDKKQGLVYVKVTYDWGLPEGIKTASAAQLSGSNLPAPLFGVDDYLTYTPRLLQTATELTGDQVTALRASAPALDALYQQAVAAGFKFALAERHTYSTGEQESEIRLLRFNPQMAALSLWLVHDKAFGTLVDASSYTVMRSGQAVRYDLQTNAWTPVAANPLQNARVQKGISWSECATNCIENKLPGYILKKKIKEISQLSKIASCVQSATGDDSAFLGCAKWIGKKVPVIGEAIDLSQCNSECDVCVEGGGSCNNPMCHCCTQDKYRCDADDWIYGSAGIDVIKVKKCNLQEGEDRGTYLAETVIEVCALCEKCLYGGPGGQPRCTLPNGNQTLNAMATILTLAAQQGAQDRLEVTASGEIECDLCTTAKDPNEMYGPAGDLLPGQLVTYEIAYENVGAGTAFGVFVRNKLPEGVFDVGTLQINNGGAYSPGSGSIVWEVGDLAPQGQPGASGKVSYSVRLRSDLPSGTPVVNAAEVHFPSVPEVTPTNRLANLIRALVAQPLHLQTEAGVAAAFTLRGQDAAGTPLTFAVVDGPQYGSLIGAPPNLTYTPAAGAAGLERIRFTASNGVQTSAPADVTIRILPPPSDVTGPAVLWTAPRPGAQIALAAAELGADSTGKVYYPVIQAQFSEPVNPATVNAQSVLVTGATGKAVKADVRYDAGIDQLQLLLREEPQVGMAYTVTVTPGVHDLRGNPMAAAHAWSFTISGLRQPAEPPNIYLPLVRR